MNDRAVVLSYAGTGFLTEESCMYVQQQFRNKFPEEDIFVAFSLNRSDARIAGEETGSLKQVLKDIKNRGYDKIIFQSLQVAPGQDFFSQKTKIQKSYFRFSVGMPLLSSEIDCYRVLDALSDRIPDIDKCITVLAGEGTAHSTAAAMYMQFEGCVRSRYRHNVYVSMIEGVPLWESAFNEIRKSPVKKIKFIPLMFEVGENIKYGIQGRHNQSWSVQLEGYSIVGIDQGLVFNDKILDIYFDHLHTAIAMLA